MRGGPVLLLFFFVALALGVAGVARAQLRPIVMLVPSSKLETSSRAIEAIEAQLEDLPVRLIGHQIGVLPADLRPQIDSARKAGAEYGADTVFWLDPLDAARVFVFVRAQDGERILVRDVRSTGAAEEGRLEAIAIIVTTAIRAVMEGESLKEAVLLAPPVKPAPPLLSQGKHRHRSLAFAASYGILLFSREAKIVHGPRLELLIAPIDALVLFAAYRFVAPAALESASVTVSVRRHPIEVGLAWRRDIAIFELELGAAYVADCQTADVRTREPRYQEQDLDSYWSHGVLPRVRLSWAPSSVAALFFSLGVELAVNSPRYTVSGPNGESIVSSPWLIRPLVELGGAFGIR